MDTAPEYELVGRYPRFVWPPGVLRRAPKLALISIIGVLILAFMSIALVVTTDNCEVHVYINWLLSFFGSLAAGMIVAILRDGITITWWRSALRGNSLAQLHYIWSYGGSSSAWFAGRRVNGVASK